MKLIIVRHGETIANSKNILQGKDGGKLTKKGIKQAREVGRHLKNHHKIDMVFCSPIGRCVETLNYILAEYPIEGEIFMSKLIEERDLGEYVEVGHDLVNWEEIDKDSDLNQEMGVENWSDVEKRVELFLEDLKLEEDKKTVLIVSHGGPIRAMVGKLTNQKLKYPETRIKNAEIMEFDYDTRLEI